MIAALNTDRRPRRLARNRVFDSSADADRLGGTSSETTPQRGASRRSVPHERAHSRQRREFQPRCDALSIQALLSWAIAASSSLPWVEPGREPAPRKPIARHQHLPGRWPDMTETRGNQPRQNRTRHATRSTPALWSNHACRQRCQMICSGGTCGIAASRRHIRRCRHHWGSRRAPYAFGTRCRGPILADYQQRYPDVDLDIILGDRRVDLSEDGFRLALRVGNLDDSSPIAIPLGAIRLTLYAVRARHADTSPRTHTSPQPLLE